MVQNDLHKTPEEKVLNSIRLGRFLVCVFTSIDTSPPPPPTENNLKFLYRQTSVEEKCAKQNFPDTPDIWENIHNCTSQSRGAELMKANQAKASAAGAIDKDLPYVVVNKDSPAKVREAFFQVVCNSYDVLRPAPCRAMAQFGIPIGIYFSANAEAQAFFNTQVKPFFKHIISGERSILDEEDERLYRLMSGNLIPWGDTKYNPEMLDKQFTCAGDENCFMNRFFACAVSEHRNEPRSKEHLMEFAVCFFSKADALTNSSAAAASCTNMIWSPDPFVRLETCAKSTDPVDIQKYLNMKKKTEDFVPNVKTCKFN